MGTHTERENIMPAVKICIIGGGSPYMTSMFASLARYARDGGLAGCEVILNDINEENVKLMEQSNQFLLLRRAEW